MIVGTEARAELPTSERSQAAFSGEAAYECDWCGRAVRPETASQRVHRVGSAEEVVFLCAECERGTD